jgi:hypothetical protein
MACRECVPVRLGDVQDQQELRRDNARFDERYAQLNGGLLASTPCASKANQDLNRMLTVRGFRDITASNATVALAEKCCACQNALL